MSMQIFLKDNYSAKWIDSQLFYGYLYMDDEGEEFISLEAGEYFLLPYDCCVVDPVKLHINLRMVGKNNSKVKGNKNLLYKIEGYPIIRAVNMGNVCMGNVCICNGSHREYVSYREFALYLTKRVNQGHVFIKNILSQKEAHLLIKKGYASLITR